MTEGLDEIIQKIQEIVHEIRYMEEGEKKQDLREKLKLLQIKMRKAWENKK
jgi:hypothetical protein